MNLRLSPMWAVAAFIACMSAYAKDESPAEKPGGSADAAKRAFANCYACHSVDPAEKDLPGPNLAGVIGRPIAAQVGFPYSDALRDFAKTHSRWTPELIDQLIQNASALVPGTLMEAPPQAKDPGVRKGVLDYLRQHQ